MAFGKWEWLLKAAYKRLVEEFEKLDVQMNQEKTRIVDLTRDETFSFLGFDYRRVKTRRGVWGVRVTPRMKARTALLRETQGRVPSSSIPTRGSGYISDQPDSQGMGQLFSGWQLQRVLWLYQRLGGEKDQTTSDACKKTPWLRLEQVE